MGGGKGFKRLLKLPPTKWILRKLKKTPDVDLTSIKPLIESQNSLNSAHKQKGVKKTSRTIKKESRKMRRHTKRTLKEASCTKRRQKGETNVNFFRSNDGARLMQNMEGYLNPGYGRSSLSLSTLETESDDRSTELSTDSSGNLGADESSSETIADVHTLQEDAFVTGSQSPDIADNFSLNASQTFPKELCAKDSAYPDQAYFRDAAIIKDSGSETSHDLCNGTRKKLLTKSPSSEGTAIVYNKCQFAGQFQHGHDGKMNVENSSDMKEELKDEFRRLIDEVLKEELREMRDQIEQLNVEHGQIYQQLDEMRTGQYGAIVDQQQQINRQEQHISLLADWLNRMVPFH